MTQGGAKVQAPAAGLSTSRDDMRSTWLIRAARSGLAGALLAATIGASVASAGPAPNRAARSRGTNLFALVFGVMNVNRIFCCINNIGELCVGPTGSPVVGGRLCPQGTPAHANLHPRV